MADTPMRPETTSEHIARDMREGRFPEQSERQMVPVKADLPAEIMVWKSNPGLDHLGTWATERYPEEAVAYVPRPAEPAQAAQVEIERNRAEAYQGGWDDGYAEGFRKAVALVMDGIPKETAYGRGVRSLVSGIIAAAQEGRE